MDRLAAFWNRCSYHVLSTKYIYTHIYIIYSCYLLFNCSELFLEKWNCCVLMRLRFGQAILEAYASGGMPEARQMQRQIMAGWESDRRIRSLSALSLWQSHLCVQRSHFGESPGLLFTSDDKTGRAFGLEKQAIQCAASFHYRKECGALCQPQVQRLRRLALWRCSCSLNIWICLFS